MELFIVCLVEATPLLYKSSTGGGSTFPTRGCKLLEGICGTLLLQDQNNVKLIHPCNQIEDKKIVCSTKTNIQNNNNKNNGQWGWQIVKYKQTWMFHGYAKECRTKLEVEPIQLYMD